MNPGTTRRTLAKFGAGMETGTFSLCVTATWLSRIIEPSFESAARLAQKQTRFFLIQPFQRQYKSQNNKDNTKVKKRQQRQYKDNNNKPITNKDNTKVKTKMIHPLLRKQI
jgi:hypothetical protein